MIGLVERTLQKVGFVTSAARNGEAGIKAAREYRPAVIVLDLMLPEMSGLEVCRVLRSDPAKPKLVNTIGDMAGVTSTKAPLLGLSA